MDQTELAHRFEYHPPKDSKVASDHGYVRRKIYDAAYDLNDLLVPYGRPRELAQAIGCLEEAMFWANAVIARSQEKGEPAETPNRVRPEVIPSASQRDGYIDALQALQAIREIREAGVDDLAAWGRGEIDDDELRRRSAGHRNRETINRRGKDYWLEPMTLEPGRGSLVLDGLGFFWERVAEGWICVEQPRGHSDAEPGIGLKRWGFLAARQPKRLRRFDPDQGVVPRIEAHPTEVARPISGATMIGRPPLSGERLRLEESEQQRLAEVAARAEENRVAAVVDDVLGR